MYRFILGLALLLIFPGLVTAQEFVSVNDRSLYDSSFQDGFIPPSNGNYAVLRWVLVPSLNQSGVHHIVSSASIVSRYDREAGVTTGAYGYLVNGDDSTVVYSIIDAERIYTRASSGSYQVPSGYLAEIQVHLTALNLGTVSQRRDFIARFKGQVELPTLVDVSGIFASVLEIVKPYAAIMIGLYGSLFFLGKAFKLLEDFVNQRHKLQVKVERRAERTAQLNDPVYGKISFDLDMKAAQYASTRSRVDYKEYKAAFKEYAAYREKKGWRY